MIKYYIVISLLRLATASQKFDRELPRTLQPLTRPRRQSLRRAYSLLAAAPTIQLLPAQCPSLPTTTMTDPPPKKVGSLRDRIAAFENKGSAPGPAPAPVPRPKPAHVTWQPKPASPPASPKHETDDGERRGPGMSAADAKESIGKLSLRERMAALQGSAAFGGGAPAQPPPRPTGEKPKWKPPPVVQRVEPIGGEDEDDDEDKKGKERVKEDEEARSPPAGEEAEGGGEVQEKGEDEPDPEEEERQRRAALAAKMARLGGARVGMGPPIFGKKPDIPPKKIPSKDAREEETKAEPKEEVKPAEESAKPQDEETGPTEVEVSPTVQKAAAVELPPSTTEDGTLALSAGTCMFYRSSSTYSSAHR